MLALAVVAIERLDRVTTVIAPEQEGSASNARFVERVAASSAHASLDSVSREVSRQFEGFVLPERFRDSIVHLATAQVGARYRFGGTTPNRGFDCSGLIRYVLSQVNIALPRTAYLQARVGAPISQEHLQPGDIVAFGPDSVEHIGIFVGNGQFVHASSVAGRVVVSALDRPASPRIHPFHGARRLLAVDETPFNRSVLTTASR